MKVSITAMSAFVLSTTANVPALQLKAPARSSSPWKDENNIQKCPLLFSSASTTIKFGNLQKKSTNKRYSTKEFVLTADWFGYNHLKPQSPGGAIPLSTIKSVKLTETSKSRRRAAGTKFAITLTGADQGEEVEVFLRAKDPSEAKAWVTALNNAVEHAVEHAVERDFFRLISGWIQANALQQPEKGFSFRGDRVTKVSDGEFAHSLGLRENDQICFVAVADAEYEYKYAFHDGSGSEDAPDQFRRIQKRTVVLTEDLDRLAVLRMYPITIWIKRDGTGKNNGSTLLNRFTFDDAALQKVNDAAEKQKARVASHRKQDEAKGDEQKEKIERERKALKKWLDPEDTGKMQKQDFCDVLGIEPSSTDKEIKKAYLKLTLTHHPDRARNDAKIFQLIGAAYRALHSEGQDYGNYEGRGKKGRGKTNVAEAWLDASKTRN